MKRGPSDFHLQLKIKREDQAFVVYDSHGVRLARFEYDNERRRHSNSVPGEAVARDIAQFCARILTHFHKDTQMKLFMEHLPHHQARAARDRRG